jgi:hypothetical protein
MRKARWKTPMKWSRADRKDVALHDSHQPSFVRLEGRETMSADSSQLGRKLPAPKIRELFPLTKSSCDHTDRKPQTTIMKFAVSCIIALLASQADAFSVQQAAQGQRTFGQSSALKFMPAKMCPPANPP